MSNLRKLYNLYTKCKLADGNLCSVVFRLLIFKFLYKKKLTIHQGVTIKGVKNMFMGAMVEVGLGQVGFSHKKDRTFLNIRGTLRIKEGYSIGRGCRFDIGENATVTIGTGGYINCNTKVIIMHQLSVGDQCAISWDCQLLDEDFHEIAYPGKRSADNGIVIGNHVWIGSGVKIYKGTFIADGCVIASDSVVKGQFNNKNSLIGGNPARLIRENIEWK